MTTTSARLFLALWPTPATHEALVRHIQSWHWSGTARLTHAERLHLTLHFIGEVDATRIDELRIALAVPWKPFDLELATPEIWKGGLAVLCADRIPDELRALHAKLADRLRECELPVEERPLRVHATLARDAQHSHAPKRVKPVAWPVQEGYALVRSLPGGKGYETLQRF